MNEKKIKLGEVMTNKEAMFLLKNIQMWGIVEVDEYKALEMAIEALRQEQYYKDLAESYGKTICKLTKAIAEEGNSKVRMLGRDEAAGWLGTVSEYEARAWVKFLESLERLGLRLCEVEE